MVSKPAREATGADLKIGGRVERQEGGALLTPRVWQRVQLVVITAGQSALLPPRGMVPGITLS